jgi:hypothetical protein
MNEIRRARVQCEIDLLAGVRERIARIRDDEDKALSGNSLYGDGDQEVTDALSEVGFILLVAIGRLDKVKRRNEPRKQ